MGQVVRRRRGVLGLGSESSKKRRWGVVVSDGDGTVRRGGAGAGEIMKW